MGGDITGGAPVHDGLDELAATGSFRVGLHLATCTDVTTSATMDCQTIGH